MYKKEYENNERIKRWIKGHNYSRFKERGERFGVAEYRGKLISLDIEDSNEEDNSLHSNIEKQISIINEELDGE